jgi:circadian clock protein KaiB
VTAYSFRLYVVGRTARSLAAELNLRRMCDTRLGGDCDIEVIDLIDSPELAAEEHIMAAPMVVRLAPSPQVRAIGDLSDLDRAAEYLGFPAAVDEPPERETP